MDEDLDLRHFNNRCRLFPLPGVVLFPHAVLPLHIFEPRYRQMTEDALAGDGLVTIVQLRPPTLPTLGSLGSPPIESVACLGRILRHERLPDGRFNFLLLGRKRVRLSQELSSDRLYRIAEASILEDVEDVDPEEPQRSELIERFRAAFERHEELGPELNAILSGSLSLAVLSDIVGHALGLPPEIKQVLLAETQVSRRVETLLHILRQLPGAESRGRGTARPFPPPFSPN